MTDLRLDGQSVAITGALGDIGSAISHEVLRLGADALIIDLAAEADAQDQLEPFHRHGPKVRYAQADVRDYAQVEAALAAVPNLTGVVGNAGIGIMTPFLDMTPQIWSEQIDTNLTGCFNTGLAAARRLAGTGGVSGVHEQLDRQRAVARHGGLLRQQGRSGDAGEGHGA